MTKHLTLLLFIGLAWGQAINENFQQLAHTEKFDNGKIKRISYFKIVNEKIKYTKTEYFYDNGQMKNQIINYDNDEFKWDETYWYKNGQKKMIINWVEGINIQSQCWDEEGNECNSCDDLNRLELEGCNDTDKYYNIGLPIPGFEVDFIKDND